MSWKSSNLSKFGAVFVEKNEMKVSVRIVLICLAAVYLGACAKIGSPTGGPKDYTPPSVVSSKPNDHSVNFNGKKVEITFDEFLQLKDIQKKFFVSPPFKKKPEVILKYKTVVVNFNDTLTPNATYTLDFSDAITDNNEGNPIRNFQFVFSTGSFIDSLSMDGHIESAFDHKPDKDGMVLMLYDIKGDSVPMKFLPAYIARSNEKGFFRFNHVKTDTFMIIGVKDANNNSMYDKGEEVAFADSSILFDASFYKAPDTTAAKKDTIIQKKPQLLKNDTVKIDSSFLTNYKPRVELYSFKEEVAKKQFLNKRERPKPNQLFFAFENPVDTFKIQLLGKKAPQQWFLNEVSVTRDSFTLWVTDTTLVKSDTLKTLLIYPVQDSLNVLRPKYDTVQMIAKLQKPELRRQKKAAKTTEFINLTSNAKEGFDLNQQLMVESDEPIDSINLRHVSFTYLEDSVHKPVPFRIRRDSLHFRKFTVDFKLEPNTQYKLVFDSLAVRSVYGLYNDSTGIQFTSQKEDYYGAIKANLTNVKGNVILQALDEKETLLKQYFLKENKNVTIDFLAPGKYILKVIYDTNGNGKWDTGNLIKRVQPEKVEYYKDAVPVRSNWDVEVEWPLNVKKKPEEPRKEEKKVN